MPTDTDATDARLVALELKLMDLERSVETLDEALARQQRDIETLRTGRARLEARLAALAEDAADPASEPEPPPPHY